MVHVPVGKQDVVYREHRIRGLADIEADIQDRHADDGLFASD